MSISVIVLTYNEGRNIAECLTSVLPLKADIYIVDSGSSDQTLEIAASFGCKVFHHPFVNYADQRNWAMQNLPLTSEWVLHLDADHRLTPGLVAEIQQVFSKGVEEDINGFLVSRRTYFMGKWIRWGGHYPAYHSILFRRGSGYCEEKSYDQHFKVSGKLVKLRNDVVDILTESLHVFIERHNIWARLESEALFAGGQDQGRIIKGRLAGNPIEKRRMLKNIYEKFPLFLRPIIYFTLRYFLRLGFLDGRRGLVFHFLQGFWFRFLVDAKVYELRLKNKSNVQKSI